MTSIAAGRLFNVTVGATGVAKRILRGSELSTGWSTVAVLLTGTCIAGIGSAKAAIDLSAGVTVGYEHDSNPIELSNSQAQDFLARGFITTKDDTVKRLTATVAAMNGITGPTHVQLQANYSKVDNTHFDALDHSEYNVGGNLDWKPSQVFDTSMEASQNRAPVGLNDIGGQRVVLQTSRQADATLRIRPTPTWQLSLSPRWYDSETPLPTGNFEVRESGGTAGIGYLGAGPLVPGVFFAESHGRYSGIDDATKYRQQTIGGSLNYKVTDFSNFSLFAGRTRRTTHLVEPSNKPQALSLEGTKPAFTGSLTYRRQLSVKTTINISAFREFQQYDVGTNTKIGTGVNGQIDWTATAKLSVMLNAQLVRSTISGLQVAGSNDERQDLERSVSLGAKYLATQRVSLHPYFVRRLHNSTFRSAVFNKSIAGLELTVTID